MDDSNSTNRKRRRAGTGGIHQRADGSWEVRVNMTVNGSKKRVSHYFRSEEEATAALEEFIQRNQSPKNKIPDRRQPNERSRRKRGTGGLHQRKDGSWEVRIDARSGRGYKRISRYASTEEEAREKLEKLRKALKQNPNRFNRDSPLLLYFIQAGEGGPVKIGATRNVEARLRDMQTGNAHDLIVLGAIAGVSSRDEKRVHARFEEHHIRGEWFRPHPELLQFIEANNHM